jgi:diacylglycerol O-acyltransferase
VTEASTARPVRRLSPEDLSILALENETVAGHTCKLIVLSGGIDLDLLRSSIAARLRRAPGLLLRLGEIDGEPWWVADEALDLGAHVVVCDEPGTCDEARLRATVAHLFEQRLDRSAPLWRFDVVPRLQGGGSALIWRVHHALADGASAMRMASAALWDEDPKPKASDAGSRAQTPASASARPVGHERLGGLRAAAREAPQPWLRSPFAGRIGARRAVAFATVELDGLRRVARATDGATINDAVLTLVAGGLRRWLEARHGHLGAVRVKVPVSLHDLSPTHGDGAAEAGNRDSFFCLDLPLGTAEPLERLAAICRATRVRKQGHDAEHLDALMRQLAHVPRLRQFAERVLAHPRSFALNVSNVRGPRQPVHVLGVPARALYSLAEIRAYHALRIAAISFAGTLRFGLTADPTLLPDVDELARAMQREAASLTACLPSP